MISIVKFKKCVIATGIFGIIVNKLCYKKKLCPIILFEVNKGSQVKFYHIVLLFGLIIYLKIEDN